MVFLGPHYCESGLKVLLWMEVNGLGVLNSRVGVVVTFSAPHITQTCKV